MKDTSVEPHYQVIREGLRHRDAMYAFAEKIGKEGPGLADEVRCSVGQFKPGDLGLWLKVEVTYLLPCDPWCGTGGRHSLPGPSQ
jgi:hypothetical protein